MSRPKISPPFPPGAVPLLGGRGAQVPTQPAIVVQGDNGPVAFPCTAVQLLTDHAKTELWALVTAAVNTVLAARGVGTEPPHPEPEPKAEAENNPTNDLSSEADEKPSGPKLVVA